MFHVERSSDFRLVCLSLFPVFCVLCAGVAVADPWPELTAQSALVVDVQSGQVLYEKAADLKSFPASLTKILTALILLESPNQQQWVSAPANLPRLSGSTIGLKSGDALSVPDLAKAILVGSANDAAYAAACYLGGDIIKFAEIMNQKAASLGLKNSHFVNSHGLHDPDHYSTARDLTLLARLALQNQEFRRLAATKEASVTIVSAAGSRQVALQSPNKLLGTYPGCDGVKSGFTLPAGHCLIASATRDGWQVMATVLKSKDALQETRALLDQAFGSFVSLCPAGAAKPLVSLPVSGGASNLVAAVPAETLRLVVKKEGRLQTSVLPSPTPLRAPVKAGQQVATFIAYLDREQVGSVPLLAGQDIPVSRLPRAIRDPRFPLAIVLLALAALFAFLAARKRS